MSAAGDFNGDGSADLATVHWGGQTIAIQLNDGAGALPVTAVYTPGSGGLWAVDAGDLDQDSKLDLAVVARESSRLLVYLGTGDGTTKTFQLIKSNGAYWTEPVAGVNGTPTIYVAGTATAPSSISPSGLVTFSSAPASGAALTWTGQYYYLVRFKDDHIEIEQSMSQIYEATTLTLRAVR